MSTSTVEIIPGFRVPMTAAAWSPVLVNLARRIRFGTYSTIIPRDELLEQVREVSPWTTIHAITSVLRVALPVGYPGVSRPGHFNRRYCYVLPEAHIVHDILLASTIPAIYEALTGETRPVEFPPSLTSLGDL